MASQSTTRALGLLGLLFVAARSAQASCVEGGACVPEDDGSALLQSKRSGGASSRKNSAPKNSALVVVDMQNDFINGALTVPDGDTIIPNINELINLDDWDLVAFTMDYHPANHLSFASNSPNGVGAFESTDLTYSTDQQICGEEFVSIYGSSASASCGGDTVTFEQTLWPDHCVQGTWGQGLDERMNVPSDAAIIKKGVTSVTDSYGAFENNFVFLTSNGEVLPASHKAAFAENSFHALLRESGAKTVYVTGLALDYCVKFTALQALDRFYQTVLVEDATKPVIEAQGTDAIGELKDAGAKFVNTADIVEGSSALPPSPKGGVLAQKTRSKFTVPRLWAKAPAKKP